MDIKICDRCGHIIGNGYQLETSSNTPDLNVGVSFDLCAGCHEAVSVFVMLAKKVRLVPEDKTDETVPEKKNNGRNYPLCELVRTK